MHTFTNLIRDAFDSLPVRITVLVVGIGWVPVTILAALAH